MLACCLLLLLVLCQVERAHLSALGSWSSRRKQGGEEHIRFLVQYMEYTCPNNHASSSNYGPPSPK
jgi:hypothetical protein